LAYKACYRFSGDVCDWPFSDEKEAKMILGGKGAALVKMVQAGLNVPPGFTFTTNVCHDMGGKGQGMALAAIKVLAKQNMKWLTDKFGYTPLVSVRSGAPVSMPGMMDTILNVGLNDENLGDWSARIGRRPALDSYRRLIQMLGSTAYDVDMKLFDEQLAIVKKEVGAKEDADLKADDLEVLVKLYKVVFETKTKKPFPQSPMDQLMAAIKAVFNSWHNERAVEYRKINKIDPAMGTACNVQAMVFGNMGNDSGTGVLFTRNPSTGENKVMGEFLQNAQGEDVVAGIRTPVPLEDMKLLELEGEDFEQWGVWPSVYDELLEICAQLEESYRDMVDIEFTVQQGELFILQSRAGKRSARAAFKIAHDLVQEGTIDWGTAMGRLTRDQYRVVRRPSIDPSFQTKPELVGLPACPGVVSGKPVFSSKDAVGSTEPCILITHETTPDDIAGMNAAVGILTQTGGATSHAAVVARAMDKACVVGCTALDLQWLKKSTVKRVTIDGATGNVWYDTEVPVIDSSDAPEIRAFMDHALLALGYSEIVTLDGDWQKKQTIAVSHWWGNEEIFDSVLDGLAQMPSRANVTLDMRRPEALEPTSRLHSCFGWTPDSGKFEAFMIKRLQERKQELQGLLIAASTKFGSPALDGYQFDDSVPSAPADYAMYSMLAA
jgi:pyruvate,orthophosphate dikinase